jgi:hypothetical protein
MALRRPRPSSTSIGKLDRSISPSLLDTNKSIQVKKVDGDNQLADLLTKPRAADKFLFLRKGLLGW